MFDGRRRLGCAMNARGLEIRRPCLEAIQSKRSGDAEEMEFIYAYYLRMAKKEQLLPVIDTAIFWPSRKPFVVPDGPGQMFAALRAVSHDRKAVDLQLSSKFAHWLVYRRREL